MPKNSKGGRFAHFAALNREAPSADTAASWEKAWTKLGVTPVEKPKAEVGWEGSFGRVGALPAAMPKPAGKAPPAKRR